MSRTPLLFIFLFFLFLTPSISYAQDTATVDKVAAMADGIEAQVIEWRRHFHKYPELSNREFKTAERVAEHLTALGMEVQTGIAHTGVVGVLKGGKPGPVVGLRADMDALPVTERVDLPFASKETTIYNDQEVGVMHACGHDTHIAILMGVAEILSEMKDDLQGTVKFIFQPAEEGAPAGEEGGARLMVEQGVMKNPDVDVIFGLHIWATENAGTISYRPGGIMASSDGFQIKVKGQQSHGSQPWNGVDPIVVSAQIISGLQTIVSREMKLTKEAAVVTVGKISGGVRSNIIPEEVEMIGTIRSLDREMQLEIHDSVRRVATNIAEAMGATAEVNIGFGYPITYNDQDLTADVVSVLEASAGKENVQVIDAVTGAEDFSYYANEVPGFFFFLGGKPHDQPKEETAAHHTPDFFIDESGFKVGVRALTNLTLHYMETNQ